MSKFLEVGDEPEPQPVVNEEQTKAANPLLAEAASLPQPMVEAIAAQIAEDFVAVKDFAVDLVNSVLVKTQAALTVNGGDIDGTIRMGPNGEYAKRITKEGIPMWEILINGVLSYNMEPTLEWPIIQPPTNEG